jgi:hypothetical protein
VTRAGGGFQLPGQIGATKGLFLEGLQNTPHLGRSQSFRLLRHKEHVDFIETQQGLIDRVGLQNYIRHCQ